MKYGNKYKFTLLGGDRRLASLAQMLAARGHTVNTALSVEDAFFVGVTVYSDYRAAIEAGDILVLPMPISKDGLHISCSSAQNDKVLLSDVFDLARKNNIKHILGGHISPQICDLAKQYGITLEDYSLSEVFLQKNALATAEGGIMIAMENTDVTLKDSNVLVSGYGRIAKYICELLRAFGAHITVVARRDEVISEIKDRGYSAVRVDEYGKLREFMRDSDVIFNTVPTLIFGERVLEGKSRAVYIELASCPGGIDLKEARQTGMKIVFAPSLPGRYSSKSAGGYIFDAINELLSERWIYI